MRAPALIAEIKSQAEVEALMQEDAGAVVLEVASGRTPTGRAVSRTVQAVAKAFAGRSVAFTTIRADQHPELASAIAPACADERRSPFEVRSLPTILYILDGEVLDATMGRIEAPHLTKRVSWLAGRAEGVGFFARLLRRRA